MLKKQIQTKEAMLLTFLPQYVFAVLMVNQFLGTKTKEIFVLNDSQENVNSCHLSKTCDGTAEKPFSSILDALQTIETSQKGDLKVILLDSIIQITEKDTTKWSGEKNRTTSFNLKRKTGGELQKIQFIGCPRCATSTYEISIDHSSKVEFKINTAFFSLSISNMFLSFENIILKFSEINLKEGDFFLEIREQGDLEILHCSISDLGKSSVGRTMETSWIKIDSIKFTILINFSEISMKTSANQIFFYIINTQESSSLEGIDNNERRLHLSSNKFSFISQELSMGLPTASFLLINSLIKLSNISFEIQGYQTNNNIFDIRSSCKIESSDLRIIFLRTYYENFNFFNFEKNNQFFGDGIILRSEFPECVNSNVFSFKEGNLIKIKKIRLEYLSQTNMVKFD